MKIFDPKNLMLTGIAIVGLGAMGLAVAQDNDRDVPQGEQRYEDVSNDYKEFLGADSDVILNSLRNGEAITFERDGETVTVESKTESTSPGEASLALGLAQEELGDGASTGDIAEFLHGSDGVMQKRADGRGWGEIYQDYGLTVGDVMSRVHANEHARLASEARGNANARAEVPRNIRLDVEVGDRPERPERRERPERPIQVNIPNDVRPGIANISVRPERLTRPERPQH